MASYWEQILEPPKGILLLIKTASKFTTLLQISIAAGQEQLLTAILLPVSNSSENMSRDLELHTLNTGSEVRVITAVTRMVNHLFRYGGHIGAYLIVGGNDITGSHLCYVSADGNTIWQPFLATGSGSMAAISILESGFKEGLTKEEGMKLVQAAIAGGVFHDMGSGQNIDICVMEKGKTPIYHRNLVKVHEKVPKKLPYTMQKIIILKEEVKHILQVEEMQK